MTFGERLKKERKRIRMTQSELGSLLGVGKTTIINWESGKTYPRDKKVFEKINEIIDGEINKGDGPTEVSPSGLVCEFNELLNDSEIPVEVKKDVFLKIQTAFINYISTSGPAG